MQEVRREVVDLLEDRLLLIEPQCRYLVDQARAVRVEVEELVREDAASNFSVNSFETSERLFFASWTTISEYDFFALSIFFLKRRMDF